MGWLPTQPASRSFTPAASTGSWGEVKELTLTTQSYAYARVLDGKAVVAVYNNGDSPVSYTHLGASGSSWTACSTMWAAISSPAGS